MTSLPPGLAGPGSAPEVGHRDHDHQGPDVIRRGDHPRLRGLEPEPPLYRGDHNVDENVDAETLHEGGHREEDKEPFRAPEHIQGLTGVTQ